MARYSVTYIVLLKPVSVFATIALSSPNICGGVCRPLPPPNSHHKVIYIIYLLDPPFWLSAPKSICFIGCVKLFSYVYFLFETFVAKCCFMVTDIDSKLLRISSYFEQGYSNSRLLRMKRLSSVSEFCSLNWLPTGSFLFNLFKYLRYRWFEMD